MKKIDKRERTPDDDDLDLVSTENLLRALFRRFDHAVFTSQKARGESVRDLLTTSYLGNEIVCLGLLTAMQDTVKEGMRANLSDADV